MREREKAGVKREKLVNVTTAAFRRVVLFCPPRDKPRECHVVSDSPLIARARHPNVTPDKAKTAAFS